MNSAGKTIVTFLLTVALLPAASTLTVRVITADGFAVDNAIVTVSHPLTAYTRALAATPDPGVFTATMLPLQNYQLTVESAGFEKQVREVALRTPVPVEVEVRLRVAEVQSSVGVTASDSRLLVDPLATGTRTALSSNAMDKMPAPPGSRGIESHLLSFPGFAANANGAIHPRGAHNQMTFVIDGLAISDQLTGAFATSLDPSIVDSLELYTGDIPAEFGAKVSGVASVTTRGGAGSARRLFGSTQITGSSFDTLQTVTQAGGEKGRFAYFGSLFAVKSNRFLDQVSLDNLNNGGNAERAFLRLDYQLTPGDTIRFNAMAGRSSFQLANLRSQHAAGMAQRQLLRDSSFWLRWNRILSPASTFESTLAWRPTVAQLFPSAGDTPVTAAQARHLNTVTWANRWNRILGRHSLRAGADVQRFPISEAFTMGITDPAFNHPLSDSFNDSLAAHDLTRGGALFQFASRRTGGLYSTFVQDTVTLGRFSVSLGGRYDNYRFLVNGAQFQPRAGLAFHLAETGTVFRASYNRNYQTPPNENLLLTSSADAARLAPSAVRNALGNTAVPLLPQRENVYELGVQQSLFGRASLNASFYHKNSTDQQDNNNFFNTGIIFPVTLARIRVNGAEARLNLPEWRGFSGTLSATHARAVTTPPFTGGLYLGQEAIELLSAGPFLIDHDQKLSLQASTQYEISRAWFISSTVRYDSGLVSNPSDPAEVAADPDHFDLLPYVDLGADTPRVRPRTIADFALGYQHFRGERRQWDLQIQLNNAFDSTALYNFQSVFVGTRLVAPRAASLRLRWHF